jgi:hypothetical protein
MIADALSSSLIALEAFSSISMKGKTQIQWQHLFHKGK